MKIITALRELTDRPAPDSEAQAILDAAEHDTALHNEINFMDWTPADADQLAADHDEISDNIRRLTRFVVYTVLENGSLGNGPEMLTGDFDRARNYVATCYADSKCWFPGEDEEHAKVMLVDREDDSNPCGYDSSRNADKSERTISAEPCYKWGF